METEARLTRSPPISTRTNDPIRENGMTGACTDRPISSLKFGLVALPMAFVLLGSPLAPAQGLQDAEAIDKIVGSEVRKSLSTRPPSRNA
jgi:hypothetical protein